MTTATAVNASEVIPQILSRVQDIPLSRIQESKTNPGSQFDAAALAELADNIRLHGVLQPVLVRPLPGGEPDCYELVAGARRYGASQLAKRETIPATVRELTDTQCLELQLIENLQRADVHELDEARGYAALMQLEPETYTVETLAEKIGRSEKYVYARLRLMHLVEEAQQTFYTGKLSVAHAFEIARLQPGDQKRALQECFPGHRGAAAILKDRRAEAVTVRQLREWIEWEIHLDLARAPFDPQDEALLPEAGSCTKCPKRTGNNPLLFPEVRRKSTCTDRECFRRKVEALVQIRVKPLEAAGEKPLYVSQAPAWQAQRQDPKVLHDGQFRKAAKKGDCPQTKTAVVIDGPDAGKLLHVCRDEKCPVHTQATRYQPSPQERAARAKEVLAERIEKQTRLRVLNAIRKKLPAPLSRADLEMASLDYFERLGHDNHRRLCRVYAWDEKKTKTSWGGDAVDYKAIAEKVLHQMSMPELQHFLVVCALVSDLYCPGYDPRQALAKDSKLARTALRYKIDPEKLAAEVRNELSKKTKGGETRTKPVTSRRPKQKG
ncbi:MAG: ParB/RepB/Spo0J family partition protein [Candidatus Acidiferrales bacterium]